MNKNVFNCWKPFFNKSEIFLIDSLFRLFNFFYNFFSFTLIACILLIFYINHMCAQVIWLHLYLSFTLCVQPLRDLPSIETIFSSAYEL